MSKTDAIVATKSKEDLIKEAQAIRETEKKECTEKIGAILQEYGFALDADILVTRQGNVPNIYLIEAPR